MNIAQQKKLAAERAVEEIKSGMIIGLGTGSTVQFALEKISEKLKQGLLSNIYGVPSSIKTENEARRLCIPIINLDEALKIRETRKVKSETDSLLSQFTIRNSQFAIDLTIDGADEFDAELNLIKGGGGALLREKILAQASERLIIITDESKHSKHLGEKWGVPVEVVQIACTVEDNFLKQLGAATQIRITSEGNYFLTDGGNFIIDANFGIIKDVRNLSLRLSNRAGIVEHGIFIDLADKVICSYSDGSIKEFIAGEK